MARPIIDADKHMRALSNQSRACVSDAIRYVQVVRPSKVHLYPQDFARIVTELHGCGYDLGRGFRICGVKVVAAEN